MIAQDRPQASQYYRGVAAHFEALEMVWDDRLRLARGSIQYIFAPAKKIVTFSIPPA